MIRDARRKPGCWKNHLRSWNCFRCGTSPNGTPFHSLRCRNFAQNRSNSGHVLLSAQCAPKRRLIVELTALLCAEFKTHGVRQSCFAAWVQQRSPWLLSTLQLVRVLRNDGCGTAEPRDVPASPDVGALRSPRPVHGSWGRLSDLCSGHRNLPPQLGISTETFPDILRDHLHPLQQAVEAELREAPE
jgi:hypothetical protein